MGRLCRPTRLARPPDLPRTLGVPLYLAHSIASEILYQQTHVVPPWHGRAGCPAWKMVVLIGLSLMSLQCNSIGWRENPHCAAVSV
jgi:hypothetical protein